MSPSSIRTATHVWDVVAEITFTPDPDFNGSDSLTYQVCDTSGACGTATVTFTVDPVADPGAVYLLTTALQGVVREGTAKGLNQYVPAALNVAGVGLELAQTLDALASPRSARRRRGLFGG